MFPEPVITYTVVPGDTIYKLAARFLSSDYAILSANPGIDPYNLLVGQVLRIPVEAGIQPPGGRIFPAR